MTLREQNERFIDIGLTFFLWYFVEMVKNTYLHISTLEWSLLLHELYMDSYS